MPHPAGLTSIAQRIAGFRAMTPGPAQPPTAPAGPASPAAAGAGAPSFADALTGAQAGAQPTGFASAGAPGPAAAWGAGVGSPLLGQGTRLTGGGIIAPQAPGAGIPGAGGVAGAYGVAAPAVAPAGHSCPDCTPGAAPVAAVGAGGAATATRRTGPPAELQAYGNGRIPPHALQPVGVGDHRLWAPAAQAFGHLMAAAAQEGVSIGVNSSYRSYEQQQAMVDRYGLYSQGGRAAAPGSSNHGWGVSIDLALDDRAQAWMRANAGRFGFVEDVPREPWHWTFTGAA